MQKMLLELEKKVADFIRANELFVSVSKVLLAVSGGADSTALLYVMQAIKTDGIFSGDIICTHINHQLRGSQADADEEFVIAQTQTLNLEITTRRLDVRGFARKNKLSIETAARKLRIDNLLDIAKTRDCNYIATAHHKNDNAETIVHRLLRGTGFRGLGGIWPVRSFADGVKFVRPLLTVTRCEIIEYLKKRNLQWRIDKTNEDCKYRRNFIRHCLIPALQQQSSGSILEQLYQLSRSAQRFYNSVCSYTEKVWPALASYADNKVVLNLGNFLIQPEPVKVELIRRSLTTLGCGERNLIYQHYEKILRLAKQNAGNKRVVLPDGFTVWREYENLNFARTEKRIEFDRQVGKNVEVKVPGQMRFGNYLVDATIFKAGIEEFERFKKEKDSLVEWFDFNKIQLPLEIRFRQGGERFQPLGMPTEKKVGKFLTDARVPQKIRKKTLIVADSEKIIWVWPIRICEQAKINSQTRSILRLQITEAGLIR